MDPYMQVRLSNNIIPLKYRITLKPDLEAFAFEGNETILLDVKKTASQITLHAKDLAISSAVIETASSAPRVSSPRPADAEAMAGRQQKRDQRAKIKYDKKAETATFVFPKALKPGKYELKLAFSGLLNDNMRGFYRSRYAHAGKPKHLAVTQFESTDARRAFPCFDEPAKKAKFSVELIIPKHTSAISNTEEEFIGEHESGYKVVRFSESPKMSTYLLAFLVGEFEHIRGKTKNGTIVRVHTTPGKKHQAKFALACAVKTLEFYNKYFDIPYPLSSLDMIAIPDFAAGAMENWGAVTYRESALLVDEKNSSIQNKQWTALVIAHELAHQWFGNLVTMEWWTHLWLNEGFASFIEYLAVDNLFPKWKIWDQFSFIDLGAALKLDSLANTHPIEVEVGHPEEISEIFDAVSYSKGAAIIRMLAEYLGEKDFRDGLRFYLKKHRYGNAVTGDLWAALEKSSGKPVAKIMKNWTARPGYPLLTVGDDGRISQSRFFASPLSEKRNKEKTLWQIPAKALSSEKKISVLLRNKFDSLSAIPEFRVHPRNIRNPMPGSKLDPGSEAGMTNLNWVKLNAGETSLFRTRYSSRLLDKLKHPVAAKKLPAIDRLGIIRDAFALSIAGKMALAEVLKLAKNYTAENDYNVWVELASGLGEVDQLLAGSAGYEKFQKFALALVSQAAENIGWGKKEREAHGDTLLRSLLLSLAAKYGNKGTIKTATAMFWGKRPVDPDIRGAVYATAAKYEGKKAFNELLKRYRAETLHEERNRLSRALGFADDKNLLKKTLRFSLSKEVRPQDAPGIFSSVAANPAGRELGWEFFKSNFASLIKRYGQGGHLLIRFISPFESFNSTKAARAFEQFFKTHNAPGAERTVKQVVEKITANALWLKRDSISVEKFLNQ
jgi:puromycin-sensitive aminopeptidase